MELTVIPEKSVLIDYTNYKNERRRYTIIPQTLYFGKTTYYSEPQWLLSAVKFTTKMYGEETITVMHRRIFALQNIHTWTPIASDDDDAGARKK